MHLRELPFQAMEPQPAFSPDALEAFVLAMSDQSLAGDRVGLVTFNDVGNLEQPLAAIPIQAGEIEISARVRVTAELE